MATSGPNDKTSKIPTGPQSAGSAIPPDVVKQTVDIATEKQPVITAAAQQALEEQKKKNEEAELVAKEHAKANEAHFDALKSAEEKEAARKLQEAKEKHRDHAAEEVRLQMLAEKQAPATANALGEQAVEIAHKIQADVSARAEAANKAREDQIAAEEALAKQHLLEEKEHRAKVEAEKAAKAALLAESKKPYTRRRKAEEAAKAASTPVEAVAVAQKEPEPIIVPEKTIEAVIVIDQPTVPVVAIEQPTVPVVAIEQPTVPVAATEQPSVPVAVTEKPTEPVAVVIEQPTQAVVTQPIEQPKPVVATPAVETPVKAPDVVPATAPTPTVATTVAAPTPVAVDDKARQQAELNAENARKEINRKIAKDKLLNQAILSFSFAASSIAIFKLGVGVFAAPLSLIFAAVLIVNTVLYFAIPKLSNVIKSAYQDFKFTEQQRYQHVLNDKLKLKALLEKQLNPITQQSLLSKLDKLAANVPNPTFNEQGKIITFPECNQLTVVSWENHKLFKRATTDAAARTKWDEKFAARDEKDIYVKITNKIKG